MEKRKRTSDWELLRDENRLLKEELAIVREIAYKDKLTGLLSRAGLEEALNDLNGVSLALAMIDGDHFKEFNDRFGHDFGDKVIQRLGSACRQAVRSKDFVARLGGDEFVIVMLESPLDDAARIIDRVGSNVAKEFATPVANGQSVSVTVSVGLATGDTERYHEVLAMADAAMYQAKAYGGNRAVRYADIDRNASHPSGRRARPRGRG